MLSIPVFTLPFIITMLFIPILSTEGIIPWFLFIFFSYKIVKISNNPCKNNKEVVKKTLIYFFCSIGLGLLYNFLVYKGTALFIHKLL